MTVHIYYHHFFFSGGVIIYFERIEVVNKLDTSAGDGKILFSAFPYFMEG